MNQFDSDTVKIDGVDLKSAYGLILVEIGEGSNDRFNGLNRSISYSSVNGVQKPEKVEDNVQSVDITMCRLDGEEFDSKMVLQLNRLFQGGDRLIPKEIEYNGYTSYVYVKSSKQSYGNRFITFTMDLEPYSTKLYKKKLKVLNSNSFYINNQSITDIVPIEKINIKILDGDYIKFHNIDNDTYFTIEGLDDTEKEFTIYGDIGYVGINEDDNINIFKKITKRNWECFRMKYGANKIEVECNNAQLEVIFNNKIGLI